MRELSVWLFLCLVWGSTWLFIRWGVAFVPPLSFAGVRFAVAAVALALVARLFHIRRAPLGGVGWKAAFGTGLLTVSVPYALVYWAEQHISSGLTALLFATFPLFGLFFAHLKVPEERMTWVSLVGVLLGTAGVLILFSDDLRLGDGPATVAALGVVTAAASAAYADVWIKTLGDTVDPFGLTLWQMTIGAVTLLATGWLFEGPVWQHSWNVGSVAAMIYLAIVGSALAFVLFYWLVKRIPVTRTVLIGLVTPWIAILLGAQFLDESFSSRVVWGGVLILGGVWLASRPRVAEQG